MSLNAKQNAFLLAYLTEPNERKAAVKAGYSAKTGSYLKHHPKIAAEIKAEMDARRLTKDNVMDELSKIIFATVGDFVSLGEDANGKAVAYVDVEKAVATGAIHSVSELKVKRGGLLEIKMLDKLRALGLAVKILGMDQGGGGEGNGQWWPTEEIEE